MPQIEKHAPGNFCWIELATSDQNAAKAFYTSLFGWTVNEFPMGPDAFYTIFQLAGADAAAGYTLRPDQLAQGVPPHWMLYVSVEDAAAVAQRVSEAGGQVLAPAFDVAEMGRMAVLQDPTGATFSVWQPKSHVGIGVAGDHGALCWADLNTNDVERASEFYKSVFGWTLEPGKNDDYLHIKRDANYIGGIPPAAGLQPGMPPHWLIYFAVADCAQTAKRAVELGGKVFMEPLTMENVGVMAVLADPQGAAFALHQAARH
jgi:predicted enzyme related to lactoylglutathione lyase